MLRYRFNHINCLISKSQLKYTRQSPYTRIRTSNTSSTAHTCNLSDDNMTHFKFVNKFFNPYHYIISLFKLHITILYNKSYSMKMISARIISFICGPVSWVIFFLISSYYKGLFQNKNNMIIVILIAFIIPIILFIVL